MAHVHGLNNTMFYTFLLFKDIHDTNINILLYEIKVSQAFETEDGSSLDTDCIRAYYTNTEEATDRMIVRINDVITSQFCGNDTASAVAKTQTFFGFENQVHN